MKPKGLAAIILSSILIASAFPAVSAAEAEESSDTAGARLLGDADGDGTVSVADVTAIQRHVSEFELLTAKQAELADVNHDGEVTVADATLLQMYLAEFDVQIG